MSEFSFMKDPQHSTKAREKTQESFLTQPTIQQDIHVTFSYPVQFSTRVFDPANPIVADALGAGRVPIATKFKYATEVIDPHWLGQTGVIIGPHARGILVDAGTPSSLIPLHTPPA